MLHQVIKEVGVWGEADALPPRPPGSIGLGAHCHHALVGSELHLPSMNGLAWVIQISRHDDRELQIHRE